MNKSGCGVGKAASGSECKERKKMWEHSLGNILGRIYGVKSKMIDFEHNKK